MGPSPLAISAINKGLKKINRYPDAAGKKLRKKLANKFDVKAENVIIGSGSEGILSNILNISRHSTLSTFEKPPSS